MMKNHIMKDDDVVRCRTDLTYDHHRCYDCHHQQQQRQRNNSRIYPSKLWNIMKIMILYMGYMMMMILLSQQQHNPSGNNTIGFIRMVHATDIKWVPNNNNDNDHVGPLPLSMKQRQQLLQLYETIQQSNNPNETLQHVAQQNDISTIDLMNLLQQNYVQMTQSQTQIQQQQHHRSNPLVYRIYHVVSTIIVSMIRIIKIYPKITCYGILCLGMIYYIVSTLIPQNGVSCIALYHTLLCRGPTTIYSPPISYIEQLLVVPSKLFPNNSLLKNYNNNNDDDTMVDIHAIDDLSKYVQFNSGRYILNNDNDDDNTIQTITIHSKDNKKKKHKKMKQNDNNNDDNSNNHISINDPTKIQLVISSYHIFDINTISIPRMTNNNGITNKTTKKIHQKHSNVVEQNDDDVDSKQTKYHEQILDYVFYHISNILFHNVHDITEFTTTSTTTTTTRRHHQNAIKLMTTQMMGMTNNPENDDNDDTEEKEDDDIIHRGIFIVPNLGDWNRYGLLPVYIVLPKLDTLNDDNGNNDEGVIDDNDESMINNDDNDTLQVSLSIVPGGHFDGQIHISVQPILNDEISNDDNDDKIGLPTKLLIRVSIIVPKHGRVPSSITIGEHMTRQIIQSFIKSIRIRTQQSMVRYQQSNHYKQKIHHRATFRRQNRNRIEQHIEEMAIDRRRRWQRKHPTGISNYRPSGHRMQNPNHAISFK